jgi:hypothetical protein
MLQGDAENLKLGDVTHVSNFVIDKNVTQFLLSLIFLLGFNDSITTCSGRYRQT